MREFAARHALSPGGHPTTTAALLDALSAHTPDLVYAKDVDGRFIMANRAALIAWRRPLEEVLGRHDGDVQLDRAIAEAIAAADARVLAAGHTDIVEERMRLADGLHMFRSTRVPIHGPDGAVAGLLTIAHDITDRRRVEAALRESQEQLTIALDAANARAFTWDIVANRVSRSAQNLEGDPDAMRQESYEAALARVHPEDRPAFERQLHEAVGRPDGRYASAYREIQADGALRWIDERGRVTFDERGRPVRLTGLSLDVTVRTTAALAVDRFRILAEQTRDILLFVQRDGRLVDANAAAVAAYGYSRDELTQLSVFDLRDAESAPTIAQQLAAADGAGITFETVHRRKDGTRFPVEVSSRSAAVGGERLLLSIVRDITARKAETARRQFLFELSTELAQVQDPIRVAATAVSRLAEQLGAARAGMVTVDVETEELVVVPATMYRPKPSGRHRFPIALLGPLVAELRRGDPVAVEDVWLDERCAAFVRSGEVPLDLRAGLAVPMHRAGTFVGLLAVVAKAPRPWTPDETALARAVADLTWPAFERAQAAATLRRERELLQAIVDNSPVMITRFEPTTRTLRLNREFERLTGWSTASLSGASLMRACMPDARQRRSVAAFMASCGEGWLDVDLLTRDGRTLSTSWANIRLSDGTHVGIGLDITERKETERALRDGATALREADRRKDEFLATLAHELRNPLAPIRNALELLAFDPVDLTLLTKARDVIGRQVLHMVRLVDDLMDVSRITRGKITLRAEPLAISTVVDTALETVRPLIEAAGHHLTLRLAPEPLMVEGDLTRLGQVVANLLANAVRYTPARGEIELETRADADRVTLRVRDNGIGIPPEMLPHIFDMFTQGERTRDRGEGGLGIGLTLVHRLVAMHGGSVTARSDGPGRGAEFIVSLPRLTRPLARTTAGTGPATEPERSPRAGRRVLIADDNIDAAESLALLLQLNGHEVRTAADGAEALDAARAFAPHVVVLDIGMPRMNGYHAARAIRRVVAPPLVIIAATGWGQPHDRALAAEAGFDHHLTKPVDPGLLERLIAELPQTRR